MSAFRFMIILTFVMAAFSCAALAQSSDAGPWADYVAGEYDIIPNITYAVQNNTKLKLDVYAPRTKGNPEIGRAHV